MSHTGLRNESLCDSHRGMRAPALRLFSSLARDTSISGKDLGLSYHREVSRCRPRMKSPSSTTA